MTEKDAFEPEKVKILPISQDALDHLREEGKEQKSESDEEDTTLDDENDVEQENASEQKSSLKPFFWAIGIILLILIVLLFSRSFLPSENPAKTVVYNTYEFKKADGDVIWYTAWNRKNIPHVLPFRHTPNEVENISVEGDLDARFNQRTIFITHDPANENLSQVALAATALSQALAKAFDLTPIGACSKNETLGCFDRPIVNCETENASVIYLRKDSETKIILDGNCMTIQGEDKELVRATDRVLFQWYRILKLPNAG